MRIGIDLMGSDSSPHVLFDAVLQAAKQLDASHFLVVIATKSVVDHFSPLIKAISTNVNQAKIEFRIVADSIAMADEPLGAFRRKKESSMVVGIRLMKKGQLDAFVSCGNTGALVGGVTLSLPKLPGISRSALLAMLPTEKGSVAVLDVGGNVSCKARHLVQFAYLGAAYQRALQGIEAPVVGLLNIGVESRKGTTEVCQAYEVLKTQCQNYEAMGIPPPMRFVGNIEGRDVFKGTVDVLVTDGFTGNVLLKTTEGAAFFIFDSLKKSIRDKEAEGLVQAVDNLQNQFNYAEYPGAIVCGVDAVIIKAHGSASAKALLSSILGAASLVKKRVIPLIKEQLL